MGTSCKIVSSCLRVCAFSACKQALKKNKGHNVNPEVISKLGSNISINITAHSWSQRPRGQRKDEATARCLSNPCQHAMLWVRARSLDRTTCHPPKEKTYPSCCSCKPMPSLAFWFLHSARLCHKSAQDTRTLFCDLFSFNQTNQVSLVASRKG